MAPHLVLPDPNARARTSRMRCEAFAGCGSRVADRRNGPSFGGRRRMTADPMLEIAERTRAERLLLGQGSCGAAATDGFGERREQAEIDVHRLGRGGGRFRGCP